LGFTALLDQGARHRQSRSEPRIIELRVQSLENLKEPVSIGPIEADSVISNHKDAAAAIVLFQEFNLSSGTPGCELPRVLEQSIEDDPDQFAVGASLHLLPDHEGDFSLRIGFSEATDDFLCHLGKIDDFRSDLDALNPRSRRPSLARD
jgi:hypothetical protein